MFEVQRAVLGPIATNGYVVWHAQTLDGVLIDPGPGPGLLLHHAQAIHVLAILITHGHWDHIAGLEEVARIYPVPIVIHSLEQDWLTDPMLNRSTVSPALAGRLVTGPGATRLVADGEQLTFGSLSLQVAHVPGHSPGHVAYLGSDQAFSGDLLFESAVGRTDIPGGDPDVLLESLGRFRTLASGKRIHPGHGRSFTIGQTDPPPVMQGPLR